MSLLAVAMHRRLLWFSVPSQALQVLPVFVAAHGVSLIVRMLAGGMFPGWELGLAPVFEALLWPVASVAAARAATPRARSGQESPAVRAARRDAGAPELTKHRAGAGRASARACWPRRCSCCSPSGCSPRGSCTCRCSQHEELATQAENNRIAVRAARAQPRPDRRPQRRRAGQQLLGLHARDHAVAGGRPRRHDRRPGARSSRSQHARPAPLQARCIDEAKSFESLPLRTKLTDEEVARFTAQRFRFPGVDVQGAAVPQLPARRGRQPT